MQDELKGIPGSAVADTAHGSFVFAVEPVLSRQGKAIGALYVEWPELSATGFLQAFGGQLLLSGLFWLVLTLPVGGLFGLITACGLVRRVERLAAATTRFAGGDYANASDRHAAGHHAEPSVRCSACLAWNPCCDNMWTARR